MRGFRRPWGNGGDASLWPHAAALPNVLNPDIEALVAQAMRDRPDLAAVRLNEQALDHYAEAEKRLRNPTVSAAAAAGVAPVRDDRLPETYSAAGVNINIPVLNGGLFPRPALRGGRSTPAAVSKDVQGSLG